MLTTTPVYSDTNSLVVKSANSFTFIPRDGSRYTTREFQTSNLVDNKGKRPRFPTWSTPTERAAYFPRVRCTTRDTGCLPIDSFLHWTLSTVNLEMKHRERHVCSNDQTTPKKRACNRRNTECQDKTGRHRKRYSIVIHIRIDLNREYRISIHLRIDNNREYCISIHHRICSRSIRYFQSMNHQRSS